MSTRIVFLGFIAALLLAVPATAAELVDLTGEEPTSAALIQALDIAGDAPADAIATVAILVRFDRAQLTDRARRTLDELAVAINAAELADQQVQIESHSDASGGTELNQRLSEERAGAVYAYLVEKGVDPLRLSKIGFGEELPMPGSDPNDARNRRIEISSWLVGAPQQTPMEVQGLPLPISLAYRIHLIRPDGSRGVVDPSEGPFTGGDRVYLAFEASMTGIFDAYRVTSAGDASRLGSWTVDRAQALRLPMAPDAFTFEGEAGTDLVVLQFYPCETAPTGALNLEAEVLEALPDCTELAQRSFQADRARDLAVKSDDEGSGTRVLVPANAVSKAALYGFSLAIPLTYR